MDWIRIAAGIASLLAAGAVIAVTIVRLRRIKAWVPVTGRCLDARQTRGPTGRYSRTTVRYSYGFPGHTSVSDEAKLDEERFASGDEIPILVNPTDAGESMPEASVRSYRGYLAAGVVLTVTGLVLVISGIAA